MELKSDKTSSKKTIVITGAGRGIGREVAILLAKSHLVYAISRDTSSLDSIKNLIPVAHDITNRLKDLVSELEKNGLKKVDCLINNAGALINKPFAEISSEEVNHVYKVNLVAPFELIQCLLPHLKMAKNPHVVNIGSVGGVNGTSKFAGLSAYSSSKAAISCLSECLAEEFKNEVSFNCLALGAVQTEMLEAAFPGYKAPMGPEKIAKYIADFALNGHFYLNGKTIPVSLSNP
ncbi:SDR family oxidoreductase [Flavobacteriales bacterium]|nr:SDR family oxidoreductase [Flavobacteriales bacterium]